MWHTGQPTGTGGEASARGSNRDPSKPLPPPAERDRPDVTCKVRWEDKETSAANEAATKA